MSEMYRVDGFWLIVFKTTCKHFSVLSLWSVLLVEGTTDLSQVTDKLSHNVVLSTSLPFMMQDGSALNHPSMTFWPFMIYDGSALNHPSTTCRYLGHLRYKMRLH